MGRNLNPDPTSSLPGAPPVPEHDLIRPIGSGSGGTIWLARNALGTISAPSKSSVRNRPGVAVLFQSELNGLLKFEPVSRLHDGLVDILQIGGSEATGYFYYVMELADDINSGQLIVPERYVPRTLAHDLKHRGRLPIGECVRLGGQAIASGAWLPTPAMRPPSTGTSNLSNIIFRERLPQACRYRTGLEYLRNPAGKSAPLVLSCRKGGTDPEP